MAGLNTKTGQRNVQAKTVRPKANTPQQYGGTGDYVKDARWQENGSPAYSADQQFANIDRMDARANRQRSSDINAMQRAAGQADQQKWNTRQMQKNSDIYTQSAMQPRRPLGADALQVSSSREVVPRDVYGRQQSNVANDRDNFARQSQMNKQQQDFSMQSQRQKQQFEASEGAADRNSREKLAEMQLGGQLAGSALSGMGGQSSWRWF